MSGKTTAQEVEKEHLRQILEDLLENNSSEFFNNVMDNKEKDIQICYYDCAVKVRSKDVILLGIGYDSDGNDFTVVLFIDYYVTEDNTARVKILGPFKSEDASLLAFRNPNSANHTRSGWIKSMIDVGKIDDIKPACIATTFCTLQGLLTQLTGKQDDN